MSDKPEEMVFSERAYKVVLALNAEYGAGMEGQPATEIVELAMREAEGRYKAALERIMLHGWENTGHPMTAHCRGCGGWAPKGKAHYQAIEHADDCIVAMAADALRV